MPQKYYIEKILSAFIVCLFVLNLTLNASAATLVWSGEGTDDLASNPVNWSGSVAPQRGSDVAFDSTSSRNCTWDLNVTVSSFNINPGYTGAVSIDAGLTIDNGFTWTGEGSDDLASNPANWTGGTVPRDGDNIDFDEGMKDCLWDLGISPASLKMGDGFTGTVTLITGLSIAGDLSIEGGFLNSNDNALIVDGDLLIGLNGTLYAASSIVQIKGDWINRGAFASGTSTVILNGTNQSVYGDNTFYNLIKTSASADTIYFEAARTQTILNNLTLKGAAGNLLLLRGTESETFWFIDPGSTRNISYTDIKDMKNINQVGAVSDHSNNSGNNSNVYFDIDQCMN
jgi:hypothetical protein